MFSALVASRQSLVRAASAQCAARSGAGASTIFVRTYAKKKEKEVKQEKEKEKKAARQTEGPKGNHAASTSRLIPKSERAIQDDAAQEEYDKSSVKMNGSVEWSRKEIAGLTARGVGHVTPAILDPVRVVLPDAPKEMRLEEIATVGVREGTNLIITLFEDDYLKHVEKAIYAAKISNVSPQKVDSRTIKVVIPRPTMQARADLLHTAGKTAEDARMQIRKVRDNAVRKFKWKSHSDEVAAFQKLTDAKIKEVDQILAKAKTDLSK